MLQILLYIVMVFAGVAGFFVGFSMFVFIAHDLHLHKSPLSKWTRLGNMIGTVLGLAYILLLACRDIFHWPPPFRW